MLELTHEALNGGRCEWREIRQGDSFQWERSPLSLVFAREDGVKVESSLGFDLWRWDEGLGMRRGTALSVEVGAECVSVRRFLCDAGNEENMPLNRDYRFVSILAWSTPEMEAQEPAANPQELLFDEATNGARIPEKPFANSDALLLDVGRIPFIENAGRLGADGTRRHFCLEDGFAMTRLKRIIRQLSGIGPFGRLVIRGLEPGLCLDGSHCAKNSEKEHWDLHSILTFTAWAANCLGDGWKLQFLSGSAWTSEIPSLAALHLCSRCK